MCMGGRLSEVKLNPHRASTLVEAGKGGPLGGAPAALCDPFRRIDICAHHTALPITNAGHQASEVPSIAGVCG